MNNRYDDLVLHLKLDDIDLSKNTTPDSSNSHLSAAVQGADLVEDDTFGSCVNFDGQNDQVEVSSLGLPGENPPHTIEGWIKVDAYPEKTLSWILLLGQADLHSHYWLLNSETAGDLGMKAQLGHWEQRSHQSSHHAKPIIPLAEWVHLATTFDGLDYTCYVNGQAIDKHGHYKFTLTDKRLTLAKRGIATEKNFQGKMAHVRVYRRALSEAEIREDKDTDRLALAIFRRGHPIDFSLRDKDENDVLYIGDDPKDHHNVNLELRNTSAQAIRFKKKDNGADKASEVNHHFELVFRDGVLSDKTLQKLREKKEEVIVSKDAKEQWDLFCPPLEDPQTGTISVFFLCKDTSKLFGFNESLLIPLRNISANAGSGARGTRVELKLNQLTYDGETTPITGSRIQHLLIISHLGSRRVPLHVGFVGSNRILNDESPNTLVLQLMNVLKSEGDTSVKLTKDSEFLISFDVQSAKEVAPWSLCTEGEIKQLKAIDTILVAKTDSSGKVSIGQDGKPDSDTGRWQVTRTDHGQGESPVWKIAPKQDIVLKRDDYILIYISNIKTSLPSGLTNLYLDYKNIPGFWDGQVVCPIEKAPLLFYDVTVKGQNFSLSQRGRDYIARTFPEIPLKPYWSSEERDRLVDRLNAERRNQENMRAQALQSLPPRREGYISWQETTIEEAEKSLSEIAAAAHELEHMRLQYTGELRVGIGCVEPKAKLEIALGDKDADTNPLVIRRKGEVNYLTILKDGKVGIGTDKPSFPLHMPPGKALRIDGGKSATDTGNYFSFGGNGTFGVDAPNKPNGRFIVDNSGKVGIGTSSPGAKLSIKGGLHIGGESDPGDTNLLVDGKASIKGGLHVGSESDPSHTLIGGVSLFTGDSNLLVDGKASIKDSLKVGRQFGDEGDPFKADILSSQLVVKGGGFFFGPLDVVSQIRFMHHPAKHFVADINVASFLDSGNYYLVFRTWRDAKLHESVTVHPPGGKEPTLAVEGNISERLDVIDVKNDGIWDKRDNPICDYFVTRLAGKPAGTMLRALGNKPDWQQIYFEGWVNAAGDIILGHNKADIRVIVKKQNPTGGGGIVVYADR